ncbi:hypothetical protein HYFRA_00002701 [Hymenoscyphus fraxineus]|uniref:C2H2-type domain-containing protein n=1 Tax=Hymenoscyphus fraxineus TaxID=746836 RepID=A0A9N9LAR6_9HELO|nr:hypothetical protein HYFRA_00002701 [Hymenoscyphus fraxineus]
MRSSFSSDTSSSWEMLDTPNSTPRAPSDFVKVEGSFLSSSSGSFYTPDRFDNVSDFSASALGEEIFQAPVSFSEDTKPLGNQNNFSYDTFAGYNGRMNDYISCEGLPSATPSLDMDLCSPNSGSQASPTATDFVVPSQTTFIDAFDIHSPVRALNSLHFDLHYDSPCSDFGSDFKLTGSPINNMAGSMNYFVPPLYKEPKSASTTPAKPSCLRQPVFGEGLPTSTALHYVQSLQSPPRVQDPNNSRLSRRKKNRDSKRDCIVAGNTGIAIQKCPQFLCVWIQNGQQCGKKFQRKEHLRRHERTHNKKDIFPCPFCPNDRFNRSDNLKQHILIHTKPKSKASRTAYVPEAAAYLRDLESKSKTRKPRVPAYEE